MEEAIQNRKDIEEIKIALALGYISYDEAKIEAKPILDRINKKGARLWQQKNKSMNIILQFTINLSQVRPFQNG